MRNLDESTSLNTSSGVKMHLDDRNVYFPIKTIENQSCKTGKAQKRKFTVLFVCIDRKNRFFLVCLRLKLGSHVKTFNAREYVIKCETIIEIVE